MIELIIKNRRNWEQSQNRGKTFVQSREPVNGRERAKKKGG